MNMMLRNNHKIQKNQSSERRKITNITKTFGLELGQNNGKKIQTM